MKLKHLQARIFVFVLFLYLFYLWLILLGLLSHPVFPLSVHFFFFKIIIPSQSITILEIICRPESSVIEPTLPLKQFLKPILCRTITNHLQRSHKLATTKPEPRGKQLLTSKIDRCYVNLIAIPKFLGYIICTDQAQ